MAITAAAIEANGWVLRVTLTGAPSTVSPTDTTGANFAGYALAPKTAPALAAPVPMPDSDASTEFGSRPASR